MPEFKFAIRSLAKSPGFTLVAVLTLALGIGANTAMFNIVNSMVLQPLQFPEAGRLFRLAKTANGQPADGHRAANFGELARASDEFAQLVCSRPWSFTLAEPNQPPEVLNSLRTSAGYFTVLKLKMEKGRDFRADEDQPGRNQVIILSHKFWLSHFASDPEIVGKTLRIDGLPNQIVGVAPASAADQRTVGSPEIYRPLALTAGELADHGDHAYDIIGRYGPGVTAEQAAARFAVVATGLAASNPEDYKDRSLRSASLEPKLQGTGRQIILMLIGLSGFVLLIACANLANLLLARAIARTREFAIRGALGASQLQLIGPLVVECGVLAMAGGTVGILVCLWTNAWMARPFSEAGSAIEFVLDWRLLLFAFAISLGTALFFGIAPAWLVSRIRANSVLSSGGRGSIGGRSQNRFRQVLIVCQFALALVLLSGAVFFVRGLDRLVKREAGWQPAPLLRGILSLPTVRYPDTERMMQFYEKVQDRVAQLPGVASAAISYEDPAFYFPFGSGFLVEGETPPPPGEEPGAPINGVSPGYFSTLGTHLVSGRDFARTDRSDSPPVIILNETMARMLFPGKSAVGRHLAYLRDKPVWMEVIGIVQDVHFLSVGRPGPAFQAYIPMAQATWSYVTLTVRGNVPPTILLDPVRRAVSEIDPDMAIKELMTVSAYIQRNLKDVQAISSLLVGFALLGLFLAALGIYGVIARLVAQRTNEIGIRMALGAQVGNVVRLILGAGMRLVLIGAAVGALGSIALSRFLRSAMPDLATGGTVGVAACGAVLVTIAFIACYLPARRAAKVDPMVALGSE